MDAGPIELRVLGCLIEKQRTTPDQYPLSLNALRQACNQTTSRDPVLDLDGHTIREALDRLGDRGWTRLASGPASRTAKFRHLFDQALGLDGAEVSLLAVLMLRGPQTVAELRQRSERLHGFASAPEVEETLERLAGRELVERQARRPGEREERWRQLLGAARRRPPWRRPRRRRCPDRSSCASRGSRSSWPTCSPRSRAASCSSAASPNLSPGTGAS